MDVHYREKPMSAQDRMFEAIIEASGVPVQDDEQAELRKAYTTLMELAARTRVPGRSWEVRTLPHYLPEAPDEDAP